MTRLPGESSLPTMRDVLLRDGSTLRLQDTTPTDFDDIKEFFDGLSLESRFMRFHGYARTDSAARAAAEARGADRCALIARHDGRVVAVASFDGLREPRAAEVAIAVADDFQGRGIGTRMLEQLAEIAEDRGITRFDAEVDFNNSAMLGVFDDAGFAVRRRPWFGEVTVSLDITPTEMLHERIDGRDHVAAVASMRPLLAPSSIAVMGAATTPGNVGRVVLANIRAGGFRGRAVPVNRTGGVVCSSQAARRLTELDFVPELAIITASGDQLLEYAAEAAARGTKALLLLPAALDLDEVASVEQEERLLEIVRDAGMRLLGPRAVGVVNMAPEVSLNATFRDLSLRAGALAIGVQAVAPGLGLLGHVAARGMGISTLVSLGGRADVSTNDLLEWCEADERTKLLMLYVESFGNPERFARVAERLSRRKPILVMKGRRSAERARSVTRSETVATLAGDTIVDAVLRQAGVLRFENSEEMFHVAELFERQPLPNGPRVAILSNSASAATLAIDACATRGLVARDARGAPYPVVLGLGAGPQEYAALVDGLLANEGIDALIACYVDPPEGDAHGVLDAVSTASSGHRKPVAATVVSSHGPVPAAHGYGVPNYAFPESGVAALARAVERRRWLSRPLGVPPEYPDLDVGAARAVVSSAIEREPVGGWLSHPDAEILLATHGLPVAVSYRCRDLDRALAVAADIGGPVTLKVELGDGAQAGDFAAALFGLEGESVLCTGWHELQRVVRNGEREWNGATVGRHVGPGADVVVSAFRDHDLGPVVLLGPSQGSACNGATACRRPPTTDVEADELIDAAQGVAAELHDLRDSLDRDSLRELILRFACLVRDVPEVAEAELNPVRCTTDGSFVLDMRVRVERHKTATRVKTW